MSVTSTRRLSCASAVRCKSRSLPFDPRVQPEILPFQEKFDHSALGAGAKSESRAPRQRFVFCEPKTQMSINAYTFRKHAAECKKVAKLPVDQAEAMRLQRLADLPPLDRCYEAPRTVALLLAFENSKGSSEEITFLIGHVARD